MYIDIIHKDNIDCEFSSAKEFIDFLIDNFLLPEGSTVRKYTYFKEMNPGAQAQDYYDYLVDIQPNYLVEHEDGTLCLYRGIKDLVEDNTSFVPNYGYLLMKKISPDGSVNLQKLYNLLMEIKSDDYYTFVDRNRDTHSYRSLSSMSTDYYGKYSRYAENMFRYHEFVNAQELYNYLESKNQY